jgi:ABC-type nitrate/sulfonate/bicarbonate transport system substrate-binding protein
MKTVRISGVPEHFNLPWHMAIEEGAFESRGINLLWTDIPEGTGKMCQQLQEGQTELAVVLTEGIVKSIVGGNPASIVQQFIGSPLLWGVHVGARSAYKSAADLQNRIAAVSRMGSGSHLMAFLHARKMGWNPENLQFEIVHDQQGAITALSEGKADYFMWEHYTTKPLVDNGVFRRLADFPTPWPCFVIAATNTFLKEKPGILKHVLEVINLYSSDFREIPGIDTTLAHRYQQEVADIREWLVKTRWSQVNISTEIIDNVQRILYQLKLLNKILPPSEIIYNP